ncbi:MAG: hypothetical protein ABIN18_12555 [Pseudomonadota bacterium]
MVKNYPYTIASRFYKTSAFAGLEKGKNRVEYYWMLDAGYWMLVEDPVFSGDKELPIYLAG